MKVRQLSFKDERWDKQKKKKRGEWEIGSKRQWGWGYEWGRRLVVKAGSVHESQLPQQKECTSSDKMLSGLLSPSGHTTDLVEASQTQGSANE
eukprot:CAMPEP_0206454238 /NCGR_PEP_ID=MMETSP0324_2-20121206/21019_1 /ASSEMBLY_ACC=CAM_ASM_000836 /TAXON_ID=2866 /ORGANISM="Crypthecodinium cohnii, Strain Seligo" /LENGTH=92 /DNA_ID=CAMNT_0053924675 /DNA_START=135 /DNA_END=414 /DNA_ORIENTATION=-